MPAGLSSLLIYMAVVSPSRLELVAIITSLFSLPLTIIVMALGGILGYFYVHTSLDDGSIQDGNKHVYTSFLIYAVYIIVSLLLMYLFSKL